MKKNEAGYVADELLFIVVASATLGVAIFVGVCLLKILWNWSFGAC